VKRLRQNDGQLSLVCSDRNITKIFEITGLDRVFTIHATREEALGRRRRVRARVRATGPRRGAVGHSSPPVAARRGIPTSGSSATARRCSQEVRQCHTLAAAGTKGQVGPESRRRVPRSRARTASDTRRSRASSEPDRLPDHEAGSRACRACRPPSAGRRRRLPLRRQSVAPEQPPRRRRTAPPATTGGGTPRRREARRQAERASSTPPAAAAATRSPTPGSTGNVARTSTIAKPSEGARPRARHERPGRDAVVQGPAERRRDPGRRRTYASSARQVGAAGAAQRCASRSTTTCVIGTSKRSARD
jgi:hypothetical protein